MTNLLQKIGLVLGATAVVAGSAYAVPKEGTTYTGPNKEGVVTTWEVRKDQWGYDPERNDGKEEWKLSDDQGYVNREYEESIKNIVPPAPNGKPESYVAAASAKKEGAVKPVTRKPAEKKAEVKLATKTDVPTPKTQAHVPAQTAAPPQSPSADYSQPPNLPGFNYTPRPPFSSAETEIAHLDRRLEFITTYKDVKFEGGPDKKFAKLNYDADAVGPEGKPIKYSLKNSPEWMSIDVETGMVTGTIPGPGEYPLIVVASVGMQSEEQTFKLTIPDETTTEVQKPSLDRIALGLGTNGDTLSAQAGYYWRVGKNDRTTVGPFVRAYSKKTFEKGTPETVTTESGEALVGPGIYRILENTETRSTDTQTGDLGVGIHWAYDIKTGKMVKDKQGEGEIKIFTELGFVPETQTEIKTLTSTVSFENSEGNPIGTPQIATNKLKPKVKTAYVPMADVGVSHILEGSSNVSLEAKVGVIGNGKPKLQIGFVLNFPGF